MPQRKNTPKGENKPTSVRPRVNPDTTVPGEISETTPPPKDFNDLDASEESQMAKEMTEAGQREAEQERGETPSGRQAAERERDWPRAGGQGGEK